MQIPLAAIDDNLSVWRVSQLPAEPVTEATEKARKKKSRDKKLRSAWISFIGRIVAQIVGSLATVALGFLVADSIKSPKKAIAAASSQSGAVAAVRAASPGSIAVLPLTNFSSEASEANTADSLTEALITELARNSSLKVVSRTSVMQYKGHPVGVPRIGAELGAAFVLEGSVVSSGGKVRVTAQLIDAGADRHVWTETYDRKAGDLITLQDEISQLIAREVGKAIALQPSPSPAALE
jgi:TolB-like protein